MGGHSPSNDSGSSDAPVQTRSKVTKVRGEGGIVDFIKKGGVTGMVVRGLTKALDPKKNKKSKSGDVYAYDEAKEKIDYKPNRNLRTGKDDNDTNNSKSIEQPKVKSQMNNSEVKSGLIVADKIAPTKAEMTAEESLVSRKRGRKTKTVLTNLTEGSKPTLSKKALLA